MKKDDNWQRKAERQIKEKKLRKEEGNDDRTETDHQNQIENRSVGSQRTHRNEKKANKRIFNDISINYFFNS